MSKVDDPLPEVAKQAVYRHLEEQKTRTTRDRKTGRAWLQERLVGPTDAECEGGHYHLECTICHTTHCVGPDRYTAYERTDHLCWNCGEEITEQLVVPFDNFGRHVGFPK